MQTHELNAGGNGTRKHANLRWHLLAEVAGLYQQATKPWHPPLARRNEMSMDPSHGMGGRLKQLFKERASDALANAEATAAPMSYAYLISGVLPP